ncbi:MAG: hypothetical protein KatS3mg111_0131 [Pirellulaceae bacterium]|nr:MAG: hypothetical protein KatS3mg111_0131 [Pirellulaceae bacterium]
MDTAPSPAWLPADKVKHLLTHWRSTRDENAQRLTTAFGTGRVTSLVHNVDEEPVVVLDAGIQFFYDRPKYRLHLAYDRRLEENVRSVANTEMPSPRWVDSPITEQVIVFDGDKLISIEVRGRQTTGALYFGFARLAVMRAAGFPFEDPIHLWTQAINLDNVQPSEVRVMPMSDGSFVMEVPKSTYRLKLVFFDSFGYDLRRVSSIRTGETQPFRDFLMRWETSGQVHYVQRFVNEVTSAAQDTAAAASNVRRLVVDFQQFHANVAIDPQVFELASLSLPDGTLFLDKRINVEGGPQRLRVRNGDLETSATQ